ncbi:MAG: 16S rRNA (guanine(966)-N(2))-methyltransferase RsmD [Alphaproteobacteria bacterium]|jgi:16S rRNA (guanine(966)-N(2))-methyltransferase RsmD|nr:16S rRNA (guanine(966)-N(2))-methyltransferase RsmD [Alphaproteobacteria bacterium]
MSNKFGRVISGKYKGKKIPMSENIAIRPTTDRVKETVFNILQHSYKYNLRGVVLDLFAGSGSLGIESLSRGSNKVIFVDKDPQAIASIKKFVDSLHPPVNSQYIVSDALNLPQIKEKIDLVFLDPPYESNLVEDSLRVLLQKDIFQEGCVFVVESSRDLHIGNLELQQTKIMGKIIIKIYVLKS